MITKIPPSQGRYRTMSFARDEITKSDLLQKGLSFFYMCDQSIWVYPEKVKISLKDGQYEKFDQLSNYDVLEISDDGSTSLYYDNRSADNAIITTGKCNSNCIMCPTGNYPRKNATSFSVDRLLELVNYIPSDAPHITITGGEPFIIGRSIFALFQALKDKFNRTEFLLLTNGRILCKKEFCQLLKQTLPDRTVIGIPLHGYNSKTHDKITQSDGSFQQTCIGLSNLLQDGFWIEIRIVVSKLNYEYVERIADLIIRDFPAVNSVKFMGLEMLGSAAINQEEVWLPYQKAFKESAAAIDKLVSRKIDVGIYNFPLCCVERKYWPICYRSITDNKIRFADECSRCTMKDACGGVFAGSIRFANEFIDPIEQE